MDINSITIPLRNISEAINTLALSVKIISEAFTYKDYIPNIVLHIKEAKE